ncbi:Uncharacterized protein TCM_008216 [Theobroma cacao]|uniref:Uncharacterized protein n=1 Tax=Theobroma cacao TaxID=3641 RepID=A0A061E4G9_THECC|nr:Uncharacterized protein TCM_008216 [Theobroma cacao]
MYIYISYERVDSRIRLRALFLSFFFFFVASQNGETGKSIVSEELAFGGGVLLGLRGGLQSNDTVTHSI